MLGRTSSSSRSALLPDDAKVAELALDLGKMIASARQQVAVAANAALTTLYWQLGRRVRAEILDGRRAEYGAKMVAAVVPVLRFHRARRRDAIERPPERPRRAGQHRDHACLRAPPADAP